MTQQLPGQRNPPSMPTPAQWREEVTRLSEPLPPEIVRERIAVALFERWEDEDQGSAAQRETWDAITEDARDYWRSWADSVLKALTE